MAIGDYSMKERWFESRKIWDHRPLFRAKSIYTGKWIIGYFFKRIDDLDGRKTNVIVRYDNLAFRVPVDPETLTRYVGCKDCNDQLIFEGDIVECLNGKWALVEIDALGGAFLRSGLFGYRFPFYCADDAASCIVVGNMFDNPEVIDRIQKESDEETNKRHSEWDREIIRVDRDKE